MESYYFDRTYGVTSLAILQNGNLASASWDKSIKIWNTTSFMLISTLTGHTDGVRTLTAISIIKY